MSASDPRHAELTAWLHEQGHTDDEIAKILAQVDRFDAELINESIFDSIARGDFDLADFIKQALADE